MSSVAIVGGGVVGSALALALDREGVPCVLLDANAASVPATASLQPIAVSAGSVKLLDALGAWSRVAATAPIKCVHVSQQGHFGFTRMRASEVGVDALGQVADAAALGAGVAGACTKLRHGEVRRGVAVQGVQPSASSVTLHTSDGAIDASLAVLADGGALAESAGLVPRVRDYEQWALSATLKVSAPGFDGGGVAFERFAGGAPLALLPWRDSRYALVWTLSEERAAEVRELPDDAFAAVVAGAFGRRLGTLSDPQGRGAFPLRLRYFDDVAAQRVVAIGNAAQQLHPVAGQGLNLGLRDVAALAQRITDAHVAGTDLGAPALLTDYASARRRDRRDIVRFTDGLISVFGLNLPGAGHARGVGLAALAAVGPLRRRLAARAAGVYV